MDNDDLEDDEDDQPEEEEDEEDDDEEVEIPGRKQVKKRPKVSSSGAKTTSRKLWNQTVSSKHSNNSRKIKYNPISWAEITDKILGR